MTICHSRLDEMIYLIMAKGLISYTSLSRDEGTMVRSLVLILEPFSMCTKKAYGVNQTSSTFSIIFLPPPGDHEYLRNVVFCFHLVSFFGEAPFRMKS